MQAKACTVPTLASHAAARHMVHPSESSNRIQILPGVTKRIPARQSSSSSIARALGSRPHQHSAQRPFRLRPAAAAPQSSKFAPRQSPGAMLAFSIVARVVLYCPIAIRQWVRARQDGWIVRNVDTRCGGGGGVAESDAIYG
ncbi:hypothetical protein FKP32DRAFT_945306 [Trametes sanguinea]|nr:hypothetical protein FKP32DRAFT_945306 [Trametes sanguinea]